MSNVMEEGKELSNSVSIVESLIVDDNVPTSVDTVDEITTPVNQGSTTQINVEVTCTPLNSGLSYRYHVQRNGVFAVLLFDQGLKMVAMLSLTIGVVSAVVYLARQVVVDTRHANKTWRWVGLLKCLISVVTTVMIIWAKILITPHGSIPSIEDSRHLALRELRPHNAGFFYAIIILSAVISLIHLPLLELRNVFYWHECYVVPDILYPVLQMIFIMVAVMLISDLVYYTIESNAPRNLYIVYKTAATLLFVNCISCLIFNILEIEATNIQNFIFKYSKPLNPKDIYCFNGSKNSFDTLLTDMRTLFQVFTVILFVAAIAILLKPIQQFTNKISRTLDEEQSQEIRESNENIPAEVVMKYNSTSIVYAIVIFIAITICIPLDLIGKKSDQSRNTQLAFNILPLCVLIIIICLNLFLIKWLPRCCPLELDAKAPTAEYFIIWITLCGHLIGSFKHLINSAQFIHDMVYIFRAVFDCTAILQALMQTVVLNLLSHSRPNHVIDRSYFSRITSVIIIFVSSNIALFIIDIYLLGEWSSFTIHSGPFNDVIWGMLGCLSDALALLFRAYSAIFFIRLLSTIKCRQI